ncbi:hypothetical protein SAMN05421784_1632 [Xenorhabdus koppenhoeferi]|uniref:Uncharacterized protein n=1 Tax=Xenorhabdus koppenhoeferi TaxID=351659 RepID=A0A1I7KHA6_9GAMM|nr:hypothetical protein SAMN05421784_1632 [Xenorhabdus koppenhoeferi]
MNTENSSEEEQAMNKLVEIFCYTDDFYRFFMPQWELWLSVLTELNHRG